MPAVSWHDIEAEYRREVIGPLVLAEARRAAEAVTRRYDPAVYGRAGSWADALDDTVQQLVVDLLLADGQLDYMMSVSRDLKSFRRLMAVQVRRLLARTRTRTVVDNLLDRARPILGAPPFEQHPAGRQQTMYAVPGADPRRATPDEVWRAARIVALVPRVGVGRSERAPLVYTEQDLRSLLHAVANELNCRFSLSDLDTILKLVLTDFLPRLLESDEDVSTVTSESLTPEEQAVVSEAASSIYEVLDAEQRVLLCEKLAGVSDGEMAALRGISRPTLASRKQVVFTVLERELRDLPQALQVAVFDRLGLLLASLSETEAP